MQSRRWSRVLGVLAVVWACTGAPAAAQEASPDAQVVSGSESVVVDGDFVRIRDADGEVSVSGDWRTRGTLLSESEADRVLVDLGAVVTDERIQLDLAGDILFAFDSSEIQPAAAAKLAQVARLIRARSVGNVHVIGHTDSVGSDDHNRKLSRQRAAAVMLWLQRHEGIPGAILAGSGQGSRYPIAGNTRPDGSDDPDGRARNRRVEIQMARREGVTLGPGLVQVGPDRVRAAGVEVDKGGVTVGGVRIDTGGVSVGGSVPVPPGGSVEVTGKPGAGAGRGAATCASLCAATAGRHSTETIGCLEGEFEKLGFKMDTKSCNQLEETMLLGLGNAGGSVCSACQKEQGFGDAHCATVAARCLPQAR